MIRLLPVWFLALAGACAAEPLPSIVIDPAAVTSVPENSGVLTIPFSLVDALASDGSGRVTSMYAATLPSPPPSVEIVGVSYVSGATTGTLTVRTLPNRFGSNAVTLNLITVDDQIGGLLVNLNVLWVNQPPVLAVNLPVATGINGTVAYDRSHLLLTDVDNPTSDQLRYTVSALPAHGELRLDGTPLPDGAIFTQAQVDAGALSYRNLDGIPDQWSFTFDDGAGQPAQGPAVATIQVAGKALPVVSQLSNAAWQEGDPTVFIAPLALVEDGDSAHFLGGSLTVSINPTVTAGDELSIVNEGNAAGQVGVSGSALSYGGLTIGTWSGGRSFLPLTVQFTSTAATPTAAQAVMRRIAFDNTTRDPTNGIRTVRVVVNDGDAGASPVATCHVSVTPVNDAPDVRDLNLSTPMNSTCDVALWAPDPDSSTLTWAVVYPPLHGSLVKIFANTNALYRYSPTPGYSGPDTCIIKVSDGLDFDYSFINLTVCGPDDPHLLPLADPPRELFPGDSWNLIVPWDRGGVDAPLSFSIDDGAPSGLGVSATLANSAASVSWNVPINQPTGVHVRFKLLAGFTGDTLSSATGAGVLPFSILIRPRPGGGG